MIDCDTFTKMPKNVGELGKLIVAKGFEKLPKVQKIAQAGHTAYRYLVDKVQCSVPILIIYFNGNQHTRKGTSDAITNFYEQFLVS